MTTTRDGGAAFPVHGGHHPDDDPRNHTLGGGLSKRDWFAGQALASLGDWTPHNDDLSPPDWTDMAALRKRRAEWSYAMADAMLAARGDEP